MIIVFVLQSKQVTELQRKCSQLQATINELERTAQQQLHALAKESTIAIGAAQNKLSKANSQIQEFHKFTKVSRLYDVGLFLV